jgi:phage FluMu gp28-like protein
VDNSALGVDLGETHDPTALVALRQVGDEFHATHLERLKLNTSYERVTQGVVQLMEKPWYVDTALVVDATGVGRPVVERMEDVGLNPIPVVITGGVNEIHEPGDWSWRVPRKTLLTIVQILFMRGQIKLPAGHKLTAELEHEIRNVKRRAKAGTNEATEIGRETEHDDIFFALCLAAWQVTKYYQPVQQTLAKTLERSTWLLDQQKRDYEEMQRRMSQNPEEIEVDDWLQSAERGVEAW